MDVAGHVSGEQLELCGPDGDVIAAIPLKEALGAVPADEGEPGDIPTLWGRSGSLAWSVLKADAAQDAAVLLSADSGKTWKRCSGALSLSEITGAGFLTARHGFVCGRDSDGFAVRETEDGGETWTEPGISVPDVLAGISLIPSSPVLDDGCAIFPVGTDMDSSWLYSCIWTPEDGWFWDTREFQWEPERLRADLDQDGTEEDLVASVNIDYGFHNLTILQEGEIRSTITFRGAQNQALFLYQDEDGAARLLHYVPSYEDGKGDYHWELYGPDSDKPLRSREITFNTGFGTADEQFDPAEIAGFVDELNGMLVHATPLISSYAEFWYPDFGAPLTEGLSWMAEMPVGFQRPGGSLEEELRAWKEAMVDYQSERLAVSYAPKPGETPAQTARAAFTAFLKGETTFRDLNTGRVIDRAHIREASGDGGEPTRYAVLDMDGDGVPELLFQVGNYGDWTLVLHVQGGEMTGEAFYCRSMGNLKEDGTFDFSSGAADNGTGRLRFTDSGFEVEELTRQYPSDEDWEEIYLVDGREVSQDVYEAAVERQEAKGEPDWHPISEAGIEDLPG